MQAEDLHELGSYPTDLDLLKAARAALRTAIVPQSGGDPRTRAAVRQLDAILRELLHRAGRFDPLFQKRVRAAAPILREVRSLHKALGITRQTAAPRRVPLRGETARRRQSAYASTTAELCAAMPALWSAWRRRPAAALLRRLESVSRRIVAWEGGTARTLASDPVDARRGRQEAAGNPPVDRATLQDVLHKHAFGSPDLKVTGLERLSGGFSRATWLLDVEDRAAGPRSYVIRQQMRGGIVQGLAADVRHEYPLLRVLAAAGVPVPEPLLLVTGSNVLQQDFMVVERLPGQALGNSVGESTSVNRALLEDIARALARLHSIDWARHHEALRGSRAWHRSPAVSLRELVVDLVDRWQTFIRRNIGVASPSVETGMAWLRANLPDRDGPPRFVHGDVTFANMLAHEGRLTALLDWEVTCLGDPAKDLAHFKPVVEPRMPWRTFMAAYVAAGGQPVDDRTLRYYEVFKAVTHVAVTYVARGQRFSRAPEARPELMEIALLQPPVYMRQLHQALSPRRRD